VAQKSKPLTDLSSALIITANTARF